MLLRSTSIKAERKTLVKLTPGERQLHVIPIKAGSKTEMVHQWRTSRFGSHQKLSGKFDIGKKINCICMTHNCSHFRSLHL